MFELALQIQNKGTFKYHMMPRDGVCSNR